MVNLMKKPTPFIQLSVHSLEEILELRRRRDDLEEGRKRIVEQIAEIDQQIMRLGWNMEPEEPEAPRERGAVRYTILNALLDAGENGLHVQELIKLTDLDKRTLDRWLYSKNAKETDGFEALGSGTFRYWTKRVPKDDVAEARRWRDRHSPKPREESPQAVEHRPTVKVVKAAGK